MRVRSYKKTIVLLIVMVLIISLITMISFLTFSPKIELKKRMVEISVGSIYQNSSYRAYYRNRDITKMVKVIGNVDTSKVGDYVITYQVSVGILMDQKRCLVKVVDKEAPQIILKGDENITIDLNSQYQEMGYRAIDNYDGDLTNQVKVIGNVDTSKAGIYQLSYQVEDQEGNQGIARRMVHVTSTNGNSRGVIYLTFDDGPSSTITGKVLDILKQENILATFFVINHDEQLDSLIKREYDEGHTVAIHSYSHNYEKVYHSVQDYFTDLEKMQEKVMRITGEKSTIIRFPGGSSNTISKRYQEGIMSTLTNEVIQQGYHYFDWNVSSEDAGGVHSSEEVYQNVIKGLSPDWANVVLMHDFENNEYTLNALSDIIQYGKENGYSFEKITMDTKMITHRVAN